MPIVRAASPVSIDDPSRLQGKRVLIVEDGPTITHGGMPFGAGFSALSALGRVEIVDPRTSAAPEIARDWVDSSVPSCARVTATPTLARRRSSSM